MPTLPVSYTTTSLMMATLPDIGSVSTLTSGHIATFAGYAEAGINARITRLYSLPFTEDIPYLTTVATRKALHLLLSQRLIPLPGPRLAELVAQFSGVDEEIAAIADGLIILVSSSGAIVPGRTDVAEIWSTTRGYVPTFSELPPSLSPVDEQKIEDLADERELGSIRDKLL